MYIYSGENEVGGPFLNVYFVSFYYCFIFNGGPWKWLKVIESGWKRRKRQESNLISRFVCWTSQSSQSAFCRRKKGQDSDGCTVTCTVSPPWQLLSMYCTSFVTLGCSIFPRIQCVSYQSGVSLALDPWSHQPTWGQIHHKSVALVLVWSMLSVCLWENM